MPSKPDVSRQNASPGGPPRPSQTKIVATVGPANESPEMLARLIRAGVDVFRLNMAHGGPQQQQPRLEAIRRASDEVGQTVAVLTDLAGPKIRLGPLPDDQVTLDADDTVEFIRPATEEGQGEGGTGKTSAASEPLPPPTPHENGGHTYRLTTTYERLIDELAPGDRIMLADGTVALHVEHVDDDCARCSVSQPGLIRSRQGVNLPGVKLSVPALGPEDRENATWAAEQEIDFVGLSFVRRPGEVTELQQLLEEHKPSASASRGQVIAKIEKPEAVEHIDQIIDATDGIMVARGDLGVEIDIAEVAVVQKRIIAECRRRRKPVIVATQMLDSMQHARVPTRAEVADVANAILDGADACMLSGETAIGKYPVQSVEMMHRIALATEPLCSRQPHAREEIGPVEGDHAITETTVLAAGRMAEQLDAKMIVVASASGATALSIAKNRHSVPAVGVSDSPNTLRRMCLYWGVFPLAGVPTAEPRAMLEHVTDWARRIGSLNPGDRVILVAGTGLSSSAHNVIVVHELDK